MSHLPRSLCHLGHVDAAALLVDSAVVGEAEARRRILSLWRPGADVLELEPGLFALCLPSAARVDASACPGAPLTSEGGSLWALPLSPEERRRLNAPAGSIVFARAGELLAKPLSSARRVDVSGWLKLGDLHAARVASLSAPALAPAVPPPPPDVRAALGGDIPDPARGRDELLSALAGGARSGAARPPSLRELWRQLLSRGARKVAAAMQRLAASLAGPSTALPAISSGATAQQAPPPPGLLSRLAARLDRWAGALADLSGLSRLLGQQHARYLGHMVDLFEHRDLTEALRHAIPLSDSAGGGESRRMWLPPRPREELRITTRQAGSRSGLGLGSDLFARIRELYRSAHLRLERQGRIREAAFVLAELLDQTEEAISFLERHGKLREAAELAESRGAAPGLVVRQWFVAKDAKRALAVARRTGAYADAMSRLERDGSAEAHLLRLYWADVLARSGDYAAALELLWALPEQRRFSRDLVDKAISLGGPTAARALVRKLALDPDRFEEILPGALALLEDEDPERASERLAFASELALTVPPAPGAPKAQIVALRADAPRIPALREQDAGALRVLARPALRALVRDGRQNPSEIRWELDKLSRAVGEPALVADLPPLGNPGPATSAPRFAPEIRIPAGDAGTRPIFDAIRLPGRRFLLALGEAGARLVTADGRLVHHFDVPAHQLAVAENGARAIALAPRGEIHRLSRIDLAERIARFWCEARLDVWERAYNGERWFAAERDSVFALDAIADGFKALWHVGDLGAQVLSMARSAQHWSFATVSEVWTFEMPALALRARRALTIPLPAQEIMRAGLADPRSVVALEPSGRCAFAHAALPAMEAGGISPAAAVYLPGTAPQICRTPRPPGPPVMVGGWVAVPAGPELLLFNEAARSLVTRIALERGRWTSIRIDGTALVAADDCGRVILFDLAKGHMVRELRV